MSNVTTVLAQNEALTREDYGPYLREAKLVQDGEETTLTFIWGYKEENSAVLKVGGDLEVLKDLIKDDVENLVDTGCNDQDDFVTFLAEVGVTATLIHSHTEL